MNKYFKLFLSLFFLLFLVENSFGLQVVQNNGQNGVNPEDPYENSAKLIVGIIIIGGIIIIAISALAFVMFKIYMWLTTYKRKRSDFIYNIFEDDLRQCIVNGDPDMKRRTKRSLWFFYKRSPVFMHSEKEGYVELSRYNGEALKKEGYFALALYDKLGMFKIFERIVLIPLAIKDQVFQKVVIDGKKVCVLNCDGFDEVGNTDYYLLPLLPKGKDNEYIDFADKIHKEYFEKKTHRQIIKQNLMSYKEDVVEAVEMNPMVHFKRRTK